MSFVIDLYTWFQHKGTFGNTRGASISPGPKPIPTWCPDEDSRRLSAYSMLKSYTQNAAREWLDPLQESDGESFEDAKRNRREMGDAHLIKEQTLSSLVGSSQKLWVPNTVADTATETQFDVRAQEVREALDQWMTDERFLIKMLECEDNAVTLGDGLYVTGIDNDKGRPILSTYDPAMYFPNLSVMHLTYSDYPEQVACVYQFDEMVDGQPRPRIRRILWVLYDIREEEPEGRTYLWSERPSYKTCIMSDGIWDTQWIGKDPWALEDSRVLRWLMEPTDLEQDFIPLVHIPNTISGEAHYGTSCLAPVLQVFDDISAVDTDIQMSSSTTGSPPLVVSGAIISDHTSMGPGEVINAGDGTATLLDTSRSLDALLKNKDSLTERLSVNSRTPESILGRVKPNEVPSGIAITLTFTPHTAMIMKMRLVRHDKYRILFNMIQKQMMLMGVIAPGPTVDCFMKFGSFLPADKQEVQSMVVNLLGSKAISLETAVTMLSDAGFPIEDAIAEVKRIRATDYGTAQQLLDLTGDTVAVGNLLNGGITAPDTSAVTDVVEPDPLLA